jgi:hypothetical protein
MHTPTNNRRLVISCLVILAVICICLSLVSILVAGVIIYKQTSNATTGTSTSTADTTTLQDINLQLDQIKNQISEIRGWEPKTEVIQKFLNPNELRQYVLDDFLQDYTPQEARDDVLVLWAFGLLDRDFDLYNFLLDLYSEQIAGFYDQETKEMFVVQDGDFAGPERLTFAHEFVHTLQDQYFDIENGLRFNDEDCEVETERCAAISALLEGDASLTEAFWFSSYATVQDQNEIAEFYNQFSSPVYDSAPPFLKEDFIFPYQQGQEFVETLYNLGGWDFVNLAYENPPITTEQILHPELYPDHHPEPVDLPDLSSILDPSWQEIDRGVMGEWYTYLILASGIEENGQLSPSVSASAAEGWAGDAYAVFYRETDDSLLMVLLTLWDDANESQEFKEAFQDYATNRFGKAISNGNNSLHWQIESGIHTIWIDDRSTIWMFAPDLQTRDRLLPTIAP